MIKGNFHRLERTKPVGSSGNHPDFVTGALNHALSQGGYLSPEASLTILENVKNAGADNRDYYGHPRKRIPVILLESRLINQPFGRHFKEIVRGFSGVNPRVFRILPRNGS